MSLSCPSSPAASQPTPMFGSLSFPSCLSLTSLTSDSGGDIRSPEASYEPAISYTAVMTPRHSPQQDTRSLFPPSPHCSYRSNSPSIDAPLVLSPYWSLTQSHPHSQYGSVLLPPALSLSSVYRPDPSEPVELKVRSPSPTVGYYHYNTASTSSSPNSQIRDLDLNSPSPSIQSHSTHTDSESQSMATKHEHTNDSGNSGGVSSAAWAFTISDPLLTRIQTIFDDTRRPTIIEESQWKTLLETDSQLYASTQSEILALRQTFDGFLTKLANAYNSNNNSSDSLNVSDCVGRYSGSVSGNEELFRHVKAMAMKFVTLRQAILQAATVQSYHLLSVPPQYESPVSQSRSPILSAQSPSAAPVRMSQRRRSKRPSSKQRRNYFDKGATRILKQWLADNLTDPYPSAETKNELALQTGLSYDQIGHWFINSRMRIWRPMLRKRQQTLHSGSRTAVTGSLTGNNGDGNAMSP